MAPTVARVMAWIRRDYFFLLLHCSIDQAIHLGHQMTPTMA